MSIRLEDYLENPNLLIKQLSLEEEIEEFRFPSDDDYYNEELTNMIPDYLLFDPEVVGYPDLEMQGQIYDWVYEELDSGKCSVKDYGCGRGDFWSGNRFVYGGYVGIENKESLVEVAKKKYPHINIIQGDFLEQDLQTDYTICIGTLNDVHGFDKWEYFNKTLKKALETTNIAIIFILSSNMDGIDGFLDYPLNELFQNLSPELPIEIDYTKFQDIYKLTVHIGSFN